MALTTASLALIEQGPGPMIALIYSSPADVDSIDHGNNGGAAVHPPWNLQQHTRS